MPRSGLCSQVGYAAESTAGTAVTVTRFIPHLSVEPEHDKQTATDEGLKACATVITDDRRVVVGRRATLDVEHNVSSKGFGLLLSHMIGSTPGALTETDVGSGVFRQIHTLGDLTGKSLTVQGGFPETYSSTVRPYTYNGCKVTAWELSCERGGLLALSLSMDAWNWDPLTALAAAAYLAAAEPFSFAGLSVKIGGTATTTSGRTTIAGGVEVKGCRGVTLSGTNGLATDRVFSGGNGIKSEQIENAFRELTGELDLEFADRTQIADQFDSDGTTALQFTWTGKTAITAGNFPKLTVTYPKIKFNTGFPTVGGPDLVEGAAEWVAFGDPAGTHPPIQFEYESSDAAV